MNRILAIDGNYFANRCIGILNQGDNKNNLQTSEECQKFEEALKVQIIKIWQSFSQYFDNFVFVVDSYSWRKGLIAHKPFYIKEEDIETGDIVIGYKAQRIKQREESEINYDNFNKIWNNFVEENIEKLHIFKIDKLEGDDILKLLSDRFLKDGTECCIFATDKDLTQIVNDNVFLFMNTKSKKHPEGYFVLSPSMYNHYIDTNQSILQRIMLRDMTTITFNDILSINLYDYKTPITRKLGCGLEIAEKHKVILNKIICGDKSDNIFPILRWPSSTGTRNYSVTEKILQKSFEDSLLAYSDKNCEIIINNSEHLIDILNNILIESKQHTMVHNLREIFDNNKRLVMLDSKFMPKDSVDIFDIRLEELKNKISKTFSLDELKKELDMDTAQINDRATNILKDSIPDLDNF